MQTVSWTAFASHHTILTRWIVECAKRWQQSLDPDLDRSEWRDADVRFQSTISGQPSAFEPQFADRCTQDKTLIDAVHRLGRHWKDIQRQHFHGRSKNCIKNRYVMLSRILKLANVMSGTLYLFAGIRTKASPYPSLRVHPSRAPTQPRMTRTCLTRPAYTMTCYLPTPKFPPPKHSTPGQRLARTQVGLHRNPSTLFLPRHRHMPLYTSPCP